ncbi:rhodanese-like domain-containing protein [Thermodesulfobacteriota bacterium]
MKWKQFLTPVQSMEAKEARAYIADHKEGEFTLLDVRQPGEYEKARIPGATLIPLPELTDRLEELGTEKPVITYCAIGGRSRAAAALLTGKGFKDVYNLAGGIKAWNGLTATGPADTGISLLREAAAPEEIIVLAYGMEEGLGGFYAAMAKRNDDTEISKLFIKLSEIEEKHKQRLFEVYLGLDESILNQEAFESEVVTDVMEGGFTTEDFLEQNRPAMRTIPDVLNIAMMLETQALDLYLRYSQTIPDNKGRAILLDIAEEEKAHLAALGRFME